MSAGMWQAKEINQAPLSLCVCTREELHLNWLKLKYRGWTERLLEYYEDYLGRGGARFESGNSSRFNLPSRFEALRLMYSTIYLCDNV